MSIPQKTTVKCPQCHTSFPVTIWESVNTNLSADLPERIIDGTFFEEKCPQCGFVAHMEYDVLYHDISRSAMIWVLHRDNPEYDKKVAETKSTAAMIGPGVVTRIVRDINELREKVAALMSGKDDRVIELCKEYVIFEAEETQPGFEARNAFYTFAHGVDMIAIYGVDGRSFQCELNSKVYHTVEQRFQRALSALPEEPFAVYDCDWAIDFFADANAESSAPVEEQAIQEENKNSPAPSMSTEHKPQRDPVWLLKNPFYLLQVPCSASRRQVMAAAEEMSFLYDSDACTDAQNALLNPVKRLSAEMDWFADLDQKAIEELRESIASGCAIKSDCFPPLSKLNAALYNFSIEPETDLFVLGYMLQEIDALYCSVDVDALAIAINKNREAAKSAGASKQDVSDEFGKKRDRIRQIVSERLDFVDEADYVTLVTILADKHLTEGTGDHIIISDVIDQYALRMSQKIEAKTEEILSHIETLKTMVAPDAVDDSVEELINKVKSWDMLVQPLQVQSMISGMPHSGSEKIGYALRNLALHLHNNREKTQAAKNLVTAMKALFAEQAELAQLFENDEKALIELMEEDGAIQAILMQIKALEKFAEEVKRVTTDDKLDTLIDKVRQLNARIKSSGMKRETIEKARENLFYLARDVVLELHNQKHQTERALKLAKALELAFCDLLVLQGKPHEDVSTLNQQLFNKKMAEAAPKQRDSYPIGCVAWAGLMFLIFIIGGLLSTCGSGSGKSSSNTYKPKYTYSESTSKSSSSSTAPYSSSSQKKADISNKMATMNFEITNMESNLSAKSANIGVMEDDLETMESNLGYYEDQYYATWDESYLNSYNDTVEEYNALYEKYSAAIDEYNDLYDRYEAAIEEYNALVEEYNAQ